MPVTRVSCAFFALFLLYYNVPFCFYPLTSEVVSVGDSVRITAVIKETFGLTQLADVEEIEVISQGNELPGVTTIDLPLATPDDFERYEGMLVQFSDELTVTGNYNLFSYGELTLSADGRLYQPTQIVDPNDDPAEGTTASGNSNVSEVNDYLLSNMSGSFILDDAREGNGNLPVPFMNGNETLRGGSTVNGLEGIFTYGFSSYRLMPTESPEFTFAERPEVPSVGDAGLKVVSFNVLNYFNGDGQGGGFPTSRGAADADELAKQTQKIVAALSALDGDIVGLMEIENDDDDGYSAISSLVDSLNAETGSEVYDFIETGIIRRHDGTADEIKVGFIYKTTTVAPYGTFAILNNGADPDFYDEYNRPALAQSFEEISSGEVFTAVVNHLKSKGSDCDDIGDPDDNDGQGNCNVTRTIAAGTMASWLETDPTGSGDPDFLIMGDLNAYSQEDPMDTLRARGYTPLLEDTDYTYVFEGQYGSLDNGLANQELAPQVTETRVWHINSEEPYMLRYNGVEEFFSPDPYFSSDHDPVIIGLELDETITGLPEVSNSGLSLYPNPSDGQFHLSESVTGRIVDGPGNTIKEVNDTSVINLQGYPAGMYFLLLEDGSSHKIILK